MSLAARRRCAPSLAAVARSPARHVSTAVLYDAPLPVQQQLMRGQCRGFPTQVTVSRGRLEEFIRAEQSYFALRQPQPLKLEQIVQASTPGKVAQLVHKELPYRFAARIKHLEDLEGFSEQPELVKLRDIFSVSFRDLRLAVPPVVEEPRVSDLAGFTEVIYRLRKRHRPVPTLLAEALQRMHRQAFSDETAQSWADTFLQSRISTEMLTSHYVAIIEESLEQSRAALGSGSVGIVDTKCNPGQICIEAADSVREGLAAHGEPDIRIDVQTNNCSYANAKIEFSYIPKYLFYIVQELLKNSTRATAEAWGSAAEDLAKKSITVTVCADKTQVAIRISDQGGGIPFENAGQIWSYTFSTSKQPYEDNADRPSPLSGWGMGLPASRLYASYLGGKLELMNMPGIGVDAYLFLNRISLQDHIADIGSLGSVSDTGIAVP
uniref:Protein-serine/threonine kinase n=1 Tax=Alexandrium catenella TaxID=2925 RepID=A0A7S1SDQ3_ALECA|mmetsp:Transcript_97057/g.257890  ORF Transcript_97057/g.257890 Transcript_97057/m.257890 type:complete len:436 (+) Transcript_97057:52-1359(+)